MKLCECGCGKEVTNEKNRFIRGHNKPTLGRKEIYIKRAKDYKDKYGVENPNQLESIKEKKKQTCLEKYGVEYPTQVKEFQEKTKQTMLINHGVEHALQSKEIQEKYKQSCLEKYGVDNSFKSEEVKDQIKRKYLENFGVDNPSRSEIIKEKKIHTCLKNFGVTSWAKSLQGRESSRINFIRLIENQKLNNEPFSPIIGNIERICLNELEKYTCYDIIRNDHSIASFVGFFPDGHILELKLFIEFDERHHFIDDYKTYTQKDIDRELVLKSIPDYRMFRISEKEWKENQEQIINQFKDLINELVPHNM